MGCPHDGPPFHPSAPFQEPRRLCGCSLTAQNPGTVFKEETSYTFHKSSSNTIMKQVIKTKGELSGNMSPARPWTLVKSAYGCKYGWPPTFRVTFISHFDKDMSALIDGTFQGMNDTSKASEIYYWIKERGRHRVTDTGW